MTTKSSLSSDTPGIEQPHSMVPNLCKSLKFNRDFAGCFVYWGEGIYPEMFGAMAVLHNPNLWPEKPEGVITYNL